MNYYDDILTKINDLYDKNPYEALALIEEELRMPYIEKTYEIKLQNLYDDLKYLKKAQSKEVDIEEALFDDNNAFLAVEMLRKANIRNYLDIIEQYLTSKENDTIKTLLIALLIEQEIYQEIKLKKDGLDIVFVPNQIELPQENEVIQEITKKIEDDLMKYPNIAIQCIDTLYAKAYLNLPFSYNESEASDLLQSIYEEVLESYGEHELLNKLKKGLGLAK